MGSGAGRPPALARLLRVGSDPEPTVTLEVEGNSARAAAGLASATSSELTRAQLPSGVGTELVGGNLPPTVEKRGGVGSELGRSTRSSPLRLDGSHRKLRPRRRSRGGEGEESPFSGYTF